MHHNCMYAHNYIASFTGFYSEEVRPGIEASMHTHAQSQSIPESVRGAPSVSEYE